MIIERLLPNVSCDVYQQTENRQKIIMIILVLILITTTDSIDYRGVHRKDKKFVVRRKKRGGIVIPYRTER